MEFTCIFTDQAEETLTQLYLATGMTPKEIMSSGLTLFRIYVNGKEMGSGKLGIMDASGQFNEIKIPKSKI